MSCESPIEQQRAKPSDRTIWATALTMLNGMILKRSNNMGPMSVHNYAKALPTIRNGKSHRFYTTSENGIPLLVYTVPIIANQTIAGAVQVAGSSHRAG